MLYVALLRGINVGGNNKIEMTRLKALFERLGYGDVLSYINSGNIVFSSKITNLKKLEAEIEKGIEVEFGLNVKTLVRSQINITGVCKAIPRGWQNGIQQKTDVLFLRDEVDSPEIISKIEHNKDIDNLIYVPGALIWNIDRKNYSRSGMNNFAKNLIYKLSTARNCNTVRKINEILS